MYQYIIGIDIDPAPFMAKLFFYQYEDKLTRKTKRKCLKPAQKFDNDFCFMDYLGTRTVVESSKRPYQDISSRNNIS